MSRVALALGLIIAAVTPACCQTGGKSAECARATHPCDSRLGEGDVQTWNYFRGVTGKWEQVWVDSARKVRKSDGGTSIHRHTFTPVAPDRVRQFCEESDDGGKTWHVVFDGLYIPREKP